MKNLSKTVVYCDDEMLMLSGIQHYRFCPRQWALIHIEQKWDSNLLTTEGQILHKHADDPFYRQKYSNLIALRSVNLASYELGLYGVSDVIEFTPCNDDGNSIKHPKYPGKWAPVPVEYKHGKPKQNQIDEVQLAAQVMCLEEMHSIHLERGVLFYGETRHRQDIMITPELRQIVRKCAEEMHIIFKTQRIPKASVGMHCVSCSLNNICLPETDKCTTAGTYLQNYLKNA